MILLEEIKSGRLKKLNLIDKKKEFENDDWQKKKSFRKKVLEKQRKFLKRLSLHNKGRNERN